MAKWIGGAILLAMAVQAAPTLAADSALQLIIGGEAYDGPPRFEVTFNGQALGQRSVIAAIDTSIVGRFAEQPDKAAYVQSFSFDIPEELFVRDGEVRVRLVNEAFGGEGSGRDRNLFLAAVAVNGRAVTVSSLKTEGRSGTQPNVTVGEFLLIENGGVEGVSRPPRGGWPAPVIRDMAAREPSAAPRQVAGAAPAVIEDVALRTNTDCELDQVYNVLGFNPNSNDVTPKLERRLKQILEDIGVQKCVVRVTGYSSKQGDFATNALFAVERAQNVLTYLKRNGLQYSKASALGAGATEEFGPEFSANRRVVITVTP